MLPESFPSTFLLLTRSPLIIRDHERLAADTLSCSPLDLSCLTLAGIMCVLSHVQLLVAPWTTAHQVPLSMGFSRQEYWSGLLFPPPGDLPNPGIKPAFPPLTGGLFTTTEPPGKPQQR